MKTPYIVTIVKDNCVEWTFGCESFIKAKTLFHDLIIDIEQDLPSQDDISYATDDGYWEASSGETICLSYTMDRKEYNFLK
jgi:hypothetical protein